MSDVGEKCARGESAEIDTDATRVASGWLALCGGGSDGGGRIGSFDRGGGLFFRHGVGGACCREPLSTPKYDIYFTFTIVSQVVSNLKKTRSC